LKKIHDEVPVSSVQGINIPLGLIRHVDERKDPREWFKELYQQAALENDIARGELVSLTAFKSAVYDDNSIPIDHN